MTLRFEPLAARHIEPALALALTAYVHEREHVPALAAEGVPMALRRAIADLAQRGTGVAAVDGDQLMGYLVFHGPIEHFWGTGTGAVSPLHGSAIAGPNRSRLMSLLFEHAAEAMVTRGVDTFAISTYWHDLDVAEALALNGFGIRLADAIRMVDPPLDAAPVPGIAFRELDWQDAGPLLPLLNGLVQHLRRGPAFVGVTEFSEQDFAALRNRRKSRYFVAFAGDEPIGYLEVSDDGENMLTAAPDMRNICGAFLADDYRGRGIYDALLGFVLAALRIEGVRRVGVDFETMNPTALHFWTKYFERYTSTFARRIDGRS